MYMHTIKKWRRRHGIKIPHKTKLFTLEQLVSENEHIGKNKSISNMTVP